MDNIFSLDITELNDVDLFSNNIEEINLITSRIKRGKKIIKVAYKLPIPQLIRKQLSSKHHCFSDTTQSFRTNLTLVESLISRDNILKKDFENAIYKGYASHNNSLVISFTDDIQSNITIKLVYRPNAIRLVTFSVDGNKHSEQVCTCTLTKLND